MKHHDDKGFIGDLIIDTVKYISIMAMVVAVLGTLAALMIVHKDIRKDQEWTQSQTQ